MKALAISRKIILEYLREPLLLGLIFAFPVILLFFYFIAFGETDQGMAKHLKIMVFNQDMGIDLDGARVNMGGDLVQSLENASFEGSPIFDVVEGSDQYDPLIPLREHKAAALLVVPPDFTSVILNSTKGESAQSTAELLLVGYPSSDLYTFATSLLKSIINEFGDQITGEKDKPIEITYEFVPGTGTMSDFEFGVPGLIVFGIMFLATSTAMTMVREEVNGTLHRLRLTRMRAKSLILGVTGAQLIVGVLLVPFIFGCALLMGFRGNGSITLAIIVAVLLSLSAVGIGLLTACFARNDGEAANLSAIIGVMMVIVSGAMYPMPSIPIATIGKRTIQLYDILPPAHASEALRRILIYGDTFADIIYELAGLTILSILILAAGIVLYQRIKLNRS
jgi:ABC-type multidrug transport system permease subunit